MSFNTSYHGYSSYNVPFQADTLYDDAPLMQDRVVEGATRSNADGSIQQLNNLTTFSATDPMFNNGHPFDNAKNSLGQAVPFNKLTEGSLITLGGQTATLKQFQELNMAAVDRDGVWHLKGDDVQREVGLHQGKALMEAEEEALAVDYHPQVLENKLADIIEPVPQAIYDAQIAKYAENLDLTKVDYDSIAMNSGKTTEQVQEEVKLIVTMYTGQVESELGSDTQEILEWAKVHKLEDLKAATAKLLQGRSLQGFRELQQQWSTTCTTQDQVHRAVNFLQKKGISTRKVGADWVVTTDDHGEISIPTAFKMGLIKWNNN